MSQHPYPVRVSADGEVAVRVETDPEYPNYGPWRSISGASLSDKQVADWMPYAPFPELDTEGGPAEQIARVLDGAVESRNIDDAETSRALRDAIMHTLRTKRMLIEDPAVAVFAAALAEWTAHWPPKVGNDVELEPVYAPLAELNPEELERLAVAAGSLKDQAWKVRQEKMIEEARERQGITWASVNVTSEGRLLPSSAVTVGEISVPVPLSANTCGVIAAHRLSAALRTIGYKAVNWRDTTLDGERLSFLVRKVPAGE